MSVDAASVMTHQVVTAEPDDTAADIAKQLAEHNISAMPVCDENGTLVGMISEGDLLRPFGREHHLRDPWRLGLVTDDRLTRDLCEYVRSDRRRARDLMTLPVVSVTEDTSVCEIARLFVQHRIKRVPVVRRGVVVGIVSRADVIGALARSPHALDDGWQPAPAGGDSPLAT